MKKKRQEAQVDSAVRTYDLTMPIPKNDITISFLDNHLDVDNASIKIISANKWYIRLWFIISNPFCYIFGGYLRY